MSPELLDVIRAELAASGLSIDQIKPALEAAIFFKPGATADFRGAETCFFGGNPKMPAEMEWPRFDCGDGSLAGHFLAQIDCASLPREMDTEIGSFSLPAFPEYGTFYLFMELITDHPWGGATNVFYTPQSGSALQERRPPEDTWPMNADQFAEILYDKYNPRKLKYREGSLYDTSRKIGAEEWKDYYYCEVDPEAIAPDYRSLKPQSLEPILFLSARGENPLKRNMERDSVLYDEMRDVLDKIHSLTLGEAKYGFDDLNAMTDDEEGSVNFGSWGEAPFQMFGAGYEVQSSVEMNSNKILLMQIGACFGLPLTLGGSTGIFHYWITPEDLQRRLFDNVSHTCDCT